MVDCNTNPGRDILRWVVHLAVSQSPSDAIRETNHLVADRLIDYRGNQHGGILVDPIGMGCMKILEKPLQKPVRPANGAL